MQPMLDAIFRRKENVKWQRIGNKAQPLNAILRLANPDNRVKADSLNRVSKARTSPAMIGPTSEGINGTKVKTGSGR